MRSCIPDEGHLMSMLIMMCGSSGTAETSAAPFVSRTTVFPASASIRRRSIESACSRGSPPVRHTSPQPPMSRMMRSSDISSPPPGSRENFVSHHAHLREQPATRMK